MPARIAPYPKENVHHITSYNRRMYPNVLLIDDSNLDRIMSEIIIKRERFAGNVVSCSSVMEGLAYLRSQTRYPDQLPDVILLDVNMPIMDGFDFLDNFLKLKKEVQERCAIFMISGTNSPDDIQRIKTYPVVRKFYHKPLTGDILDEISSLSKR